LVNQLASLERRTSRGGKETIDHSPGAALAIFSIAHRFIDLRHLGVSVDRVSYKDTSAKQG